MRTIALILKLLPAILETIKAIEASVGAGQGLTKKKVVLTALAAGSQFLNDADPNLLQAVDKTIDGVVAVLNGAGIFKHRT